MTQSGDVSFFSQDLGTILRLAFRTESYGQDGTGNFDIGTFQVVTMDDTSAFFDGQVTMNEADGVGFNVGLGYRWMNYPGYSGDLGRMDGISVWARSSAEPRNTMPLSHQTNGGRCQPLPGVLYYEAR